MIHASVELIEAMRGVCPWGDFDECMSDDSDEPFNAACADVWNPVVLASAGFASDGNTKEHLGTVTCPTCLSLMREARGPVRDDALQEREMAARTREVEQEINDERRSA